jgi:hypothetical protein
MSELKDVRTRWGRVEGAEGESMGSPRRRRERGGRSWGVWLLSVIGGIFRDFLELEVYSTTRAVAAVSLTATVLLSSVPQCQMSLTLLGLKV